MESINGVLGKVPVQNVLAEFVGVALFAFFGGACDANSVSSGLATAALGNGLCLAVLIYATAGISGGHLNPAVSIAMAFTKNIGVRRMCVYIAAQVLGAITGAVFLRLTLPPTFLDTPFITRGSLTAAHPVQVLLLEFITTFVLVYTVFAVVCDETGKAKNAAPLIIGLSVTVGIFAEGPFTGGSMNPARSFGAAVAFFNFDHLLIYILATCMGGLLAGAVYDKLFIESKGDQDPGKYDEPDQA